MRKNSMPKQVPKIGDIFLVPIDDNSSVFGQIVEIEKEVLNSITCAYFNCREGCGGLDLSAPISIQFVTRDLFTNGTWRRVSNKPVEISDNVFPHRYTAKNGWIGAEVIGSGNIKSFLSAFFGLRAWDEMNDPNYYEKLLLPGVHRHGHA